MSLIFYANLPDCHRSDIVRKHAYYNFMDISKYLCKAISVLESQVYTIFWEEVEKEELYEIFGHKLFIEKGGIWIRLIEPENKTYGENVYDTFYWANYIMEISEEGEKNGIDIKVLDKIPDQAILLLERKPDTKKIGVKPSTYQIRTQIQALERLRSKPHPLHRPLIRLIENVNHVRWTSFDPIDIIEWYFLTDESRPGTLEQREFVIKAISTPDFAFLEGPPGSGKTTAICELIIQLITREKKIMLCASTHVAVDNVLEMIMKNRNVIAVRIGDKEKISPKIRKFQIEERVKTEKKEIVSYLTRLKSRSASQEYLLRSLQSDNSNSVISNLILESANLICGTTIGILQHPEIKNNKFKQKPIFDYLIIDEASKTTSQEFLVPAVFAKRWILVGDPKQLSPYVETSIVESNISALLDERDSNICLALFYCKNKKLNLIAVENDENIRNIYIEQAKNLALNPFLIDKNTNPTLKNKLEILGSQVIVGDVENLIRFEKYLPNDIFFLHGENNFRIFNRRREFWFKNNSSIKDKFEEKKWAEEITWRLIRAYELRKTPKEQKNLREHIDFLTPKYLPDDQERDLKNDLYRIRRIALPSIIELLQEGFKRFRADSIGTTLSDGFNTEAFSDRHVLLTYQHRMHPEISKFPRKFIYNEDALLDPSGMAQIRDWSYNRYTNRAIWINTRGLVENNQNLKEINIIINELQKFLDWAILNPKENGDLWEIAILTFYRAQEKLLIKKLQEYFRSRNVHQITLKKYDAQINICTVDRFQGHEADIVFLSFVQNYREGFLNSINRLNVAITRAKYQLVLVGNQNFFEQPRRSEILRNLALSMPKIIDYSMRS